MNKISIKEKCACVCFAYITGQISFDTFEMFMHLQKLKFNNEDYPDVFEKSFIEKYSYLFK